MTGFSSLSIRNKIIIIILSVSLFVVSLTGAARIAWDAQQGKQALVDELTTLMQLIGDRSSAALAFEDARLAEENLSTLQAMPHILEACLYRADNTLLAQYRRNGNITSSCISSKQISEEPHSFDSNRLNISKDIKQGNLVLGWIYLASDYSLIDARLKNQLIFTLVALSVAILISIFLANWAQTLISKPIIEITRVAQIIEEAKDHSIRVEFSGKDEVAQLAHTFNSMLDALEVKNEQLRRSQKMDALGKLTGGVAHDYNNMLGVVLGYADLLKSKLDDNPKTNKYIDEIIHASERSAKLTQKLLAFSRKKSADASAVNVNQLLQDEQHMLEKTLTARIRLIYKLEPELYPVWLDDDDLEDAILNMSINAMHSIKDSGKLTIETRNDVITDTDTERFQLTPGDYVVLSLTDTGSGIDTNSLSKIFDPFFSTKGDKGTGLGLSQVYGFVKSSGGTIKVYSEINSGTKFSLYFPRHISSDMEKNIVTQSDAIYSGNGESILIVDDEVTLCALTAEILSSNGYKVTQAEDAIQALKILEANHHFDVLFTDVIMPEMDGYELAAIVKDKYPSIKIQLASGFTDDRHLNMINSEIHQQLIRKPYSSKTLLRTLYRLINE